MMDNHILDKDGNPQLEPDVVKWAKWCEAANRRIALFDVGDVRISTVFLGIDHNFLDGGKPILYETMIFGGVNDQYQERYATKEEALEGHKRAIELVKSGKQS